MQQVAAVAGVRARRRGPRFGHWRGLHARKFRGTSAPQKPRRAGNPRLLGDHDPPIDLVHLARQCQGDPGLEEELLGLFRRQLARRWPRNCPIRECGSELKANIAHKLRGSALAVGAGRVARAAEAIEAMARPAGGGDAPRTRKAVRWRSGAALQAAVAEAIAQIDRLRR